MIPFAIGAAVSGLGVFFALVRSEPSAGQFRLLGLGAFMLILAGFGMLRILPNGSGIARTMASVGFLWLAWVALTAFLTQALRRKYPLHANAATLAGAAAALAPAAGFVIAALMK